MKITDVKTYICHAGWRNWLFLKMETDKGIYGIGEATLEGKELAVQTAIGELKNYLLGKDPREIEKHWRQMYSGFFWRGGPVLLTAISGLEIAMWDILGKELNTPVYQLLGGSYSNPVRVYANGWYNPSWSPDQTAEGAKKIVSEGFNAMKWDPFRGAGLKTTPADEDYAVECVKAVRKAVGDKIDLLVEVHGRLTPNTAIRIGRKLEDLRIFWYEEPVPPDNVDNMVKVSRAVDVPIATGERLFTRYGFWHLIKEQAADIIQPDVLHAGGLYETKKNRRHG